MKQLFEKLWSDSKLGWRLARMVLLFGLALVIFVMLFEDQFIYYPVKYPEGWWEIDSRPVSDGRLVPQVEDVWLFTQDGVKLHAWYFTPQRSEAGAMVPVPTEATLLYFHGNGGNLTYWYDVIARLTTQPLQVLIVDYRGYGRSEGSPSEQGLYLDAQAAWDYLTGQRSIAPGRIILLGESLGGAVAVDLAAKVQPAGLIVQSSFTSVADMAARVMPFIPSFLIRTKMASIEKIAQVQSPKLFIHSPADEIVPYELGRRLFAAAAEPKEFHEVPGAGHNETFLVGGERYFEAINRFVSRSVTAAP